VSGRVFRSEPSSFWIDKLDNTAYATSSQKSGDNVRIGYACGRIKPHWPQVPSKPHNRKLRAPFRRYKPFKRRIAQRRQKRHILAHLPKQTTRSTGFLSKTCDANSARPRTRQSWRRDDCLPPANDARGPENPARHTSQIRTAWRSDSIGSRVGMNSWPT
jgi:hypothetical protein